MFELDISPHLLAYSLATGQTNANIIILCLHDSNAVSQLIEWDEEELLSILFNSKASVNNNGLKDLILLTIPFRLSI
jgi:hypothetical protein